MFEVLGTSRIVLIVSSVGVLEKWASLIGLVEVFVASRTVLIVSSEGVLEK